MIIAIQNNRVLFHPSHDSGFINFGYDDRRSEIKPVICHSCQSTILELLPSSTLSTQYEFQRASIQIASQNYNSCDNIKRIETHRYTWITADTYQLARNCSCAISQFSFTSRTQFVILFPCYSQDIPRVMLVFFLQQYGIVNHILLHSPYQYFLVEEIWLHTARKIAALTENIINTNIVNFVQNLATSGDTRAQTMLGLMYLMGIGVTKDRETAFRWYSWAKIRGEHAARFAQTIWKYDHEGVHPDFLYSSRLLLQIFDKKGPGWYLHLGIAYMKGEFVQRDVSKSHYFFRKASQNGDPLSKCRLGFMYEHGIGARQNFEKAQSLYQSANSNGFGLSYILLGDLYAHGRGVHRSHSNALSLYEKAAELGFTGALCAIADLFRRDGALQNLDKAELLYQNVVERGYEIGLVKLAEMWKELDQQTKEMQSRILSFYMQACLAGNSDAMVQLGVMFRSGHLEFVNFEVAHRLFSLAEERGAYDAVALLGSMYDSGQGVDQSSQKAEAYYRKGVMHGNPLCYMSLANMLTRSKKTYKQKKEGRNLLRKAFTFGNPVIKCESLSRLGRLYEEGRGVCRNNRRAFCLYADCERFPDCDGKNRARYRLGNMYEKGLGTTMDLSMAIALYQSAGAVENGSAYLRLGRIYQYGLGVEKCTEMATDLYEQAVMVGNVHAAYKLAEMYGGNNLQGKDAQYSASLYLFAARHGHAKAQYRLGLLKLYGKKLQEDHCDAKYWLEQAAAQGHQTAAILVKEIEFLPPSRL